MSTQIKDVATMYNVNSKLNNNIQCNNVHQVLASFPDLVTDDYQGFYVNRLKQMGVARFTELANKARASSNSPARLFSWMLNNPEKVR